MFLKILFPVLFLAGSAFAQVPGELHVAGFGGVNNTDDSLLIPNNMAQDAANVLTDLGDMRPMPGNVAKYSVGKSSITFLAEMVDATNRRITVMRSGAEIIASSTTGGLETIKTLTADRDVDAVAAFKLMYFVDGVAPFTFNGTSVSVNASMEPCRFTELYANRLACVNIATDTSKVMLSTYNLPDNWAITTTADSAVVKYWKRGNGEQITCVKTTPYGLFIGKPSSAGILKGDDANKFYWYSLSEDIGCVDDRTVQMVDGAVTWQARDGVYSWPGSGRPALQSQEITTLMKSARVASSSEQAWTISTQLGWETGSSTGWETAVVPGTLKAKTYNNESKELMPYPAGFSIFNQNGSAWGYLQMEDASTGAMIASTTFNSRSLTDININLGVYPSQQVKLHLCQASNLCSSGYVNALSTEYDGKYGARIRYRYSSPGSVVWYPAFTAYSTITSLGYDTGITVPEYSAPVLDGSGVEVSFYTSADNSTWSGPLTFPLSAGDKKRYWRYSYGFGATMPDMKSVTVSVLDTAPYKSAVIDAGPSISTWRDFSLSGTASEVNLSSFQFRSSPVTFTADAVSPAWITQPNNMAPAAAVNRYFQYQILPNVTSSTQALSFNTSLVSWVNGTQAPRAASVVSNGRYLLCFSVSSILSNDTCVLWMKNKKWMPIIGPSYGSLALYDGVPIAGDGTSGSKVWNILQDGVYKYDDQPINAFWVTKDYSFDKLNAHKVMDRVWISAQNDPAASITAAWQRDRDGVWYSSTTALNDASFVVRELDGLFLDVTPLGRQFRFKFSNSELDKWFRLKLFSLYYHVNELIK